MAEVNLASHPLNAAKFGSGDHCSQACLGRRLVSMAPSSQGKWRWERRMGRPRRRWRRSWRRGRGRRTAHVHGRRYDWRGHREHSGVPLERRTCRGRKNTILLVNSHQESTSMCYYDNNIDIIIIYDEYFVCGRGGLSLFHVPELEDRRSRSICACICCCCSIICLHNKEIFNISFSHLSFYYPG